MRVHDNPMNLSRTIVLESNEMRHIAQQLPDYLAKSMANKFVEENWPIIKANKAFMKDVKSLVLEQSAEKITKLIEEHISKSLGVTTS